MDKQLKLIADLAHSFAVNLSEGKYEAAHNLLTDALKLVYAPDWLRDQYTKMIEYGEGAPTYIEVGSVNSMHGWAAYKEGDIGHVYVVIMGDGFSEAVALFFNTENGEPRVRFIEWGRP